MRRGRRQAVRDAVAVSIGAALVAAAFVLPRMNLGVRPRLDVGAEKFATHAGSAPIFGEWLIHAGWGTGPAIALAVVVVVAWGPTLAQRLSWRALTLGSWAVAGGWAFALAMIDGWQRGFAGRLTTRDEYLSQVPGVTDIPATLRTFAGRIVDYQPHSWTTHVSGHPPGALLTFVALAPTAIWVAVSADGYFAGVAAWGIALLAVAVHRPVRFPALTAAAAGLLLGWGVFCNYGLMLMGLPAAAVLASAADWRAILRALGPAALAAIGVAVAFAVAGFYWFDGYHLVQQRYWQGIAKDRPFQYWSWANLACVVCAIGLGGVAGLGRVFDGAAVRRRSGFHLLLLGVLAAVVCADLSMLSKAEVERIWLPFTIWLTAATALLPVRSHRIWLALNAAGAIALNTIILTNW